MELDIEQLNLILRYVVANNKLLTIKLETKKILEFLITNNLSKLKRISEIFLIKKKIEKVHLIKKINITMSVILNIIDFWVQARKDSWLLLK